MVTVCRPAQSPTHDVAVAVRAATATPLAFGDATALVVAVAAHHPNAMMLFHQRPVMDTSPPTVSHRWGHLASHAIGSDTKDTKTEMNRSSW
jgi:hypothetical protein